MRSLSQRRREVRGRSICRTLVTDLCRTALGMECCTQIAATGQTGCSFFFRTICSTFCALVCFYTTARPSARSGAQDLAGASGLLRLETLLDHVEYP